MTTFRPTRDGVLMDRGGPSVLLTLEQAEGLMDIYTQEVERCEAMAAECRRRFNALFDARCAAFDASRDHAPITSAPTLKGAGHQPPSLT